MYLEAIKDTLLQIHYACITFKISLRIFSATNLYVIPSNSIQSQEYTDFGIKKVFSGRTKLGLSCMRKKNNASFPSFKSGNL